jgi:DNA mismatch endonuclease (patch repair protein)
MDIISREKRSLNMSKIKSKNTRPEIKVRSFLHQLGYRFRLHRNDLPGKPDIVLPKYKTVIFVHGCFWHRHQGCRYAYAPKSRVKFWEEKFQQNVARDRTKTEKLKQSGWFVMVIWECETKNNEKLLQSLNPLTELRESE